MRTDLVVSTYHPSNSIRNPDSGLWAFRYCFGYIQNTRGRGTELGLGVGWLGWTVGQGIRGGIGPAAVS